MKKKYTFIQAHDGFSIGQEVELTAEMAIPLLDDGLVVTASEWAAKQEVIKATEKRKTDGENLIKACIAKAKAADKIEPKDETVQASWLKRYNEENVPLDLIQSAIEALPTKASKDGGKRLTSGQDDPVFATLDRVTPDAKQIIQGVFKAYEPDFKSRGNGGLVRANLNSERGLEDAMVLAREKSRRFQELANIITAGGDFRLTEDVIKATADNYADPAGALGVLNTALTLQWNLGYLENQLILLNDITTDMSNTPILFNQYARTRYIKVPGVQLKTNANSWSGSTGNDVDVNIQMNNYAGVPLTLNNFTLGSTTRQLFNEQKAPQLYGLGEYILYTLINNIMVGNTRFNNNGNTTAQVTFNPGYTSPTLNAPAFNVAGATLATFVAGLPAALDLAKFPGGDEPDGATDLARFCWVHTSLYAQAAQDTNFLLNQSIQGISQNKGENLIKTGQFTQLGNMKFRKSQLITDQCTTNGATGADGAANAIFIVPGNYTAAKIVGLAGTRSCLLLCSRAPLDYTKVMPEIPSTAAIELVTSPNLGITFMVVKYLDHGAENANMRVQLMWGTAIGDERQGMPLRQA